jgi:tRNA nucleotidyltransferase (CCA-adding enzyme)
MTRLVFDNKTKHEVLTLIEFHDFDINAEEKSVRRLLAKIGCEQFKLLLDLKKADALAQAPTKTGEKLQKLEQIRGIFEKIVANGDSLSIKGLAISGDDLMGLGMKQGKDIGRVLQSLFEFVLDNPQSNKKEVLVEMAKQLI